MLGLDLTALPGPAQKILGGTAPAAAQMMAARGIIPGLKPGDVVTVLAALTTSADAKVAETAHETLRKLPDAMLQGALGADLQPPVLEHLADAYASNAEVVERLLRMPQLGGAALEILADRADERIGELIATNEEKLLAFPNVIERLYMNKRVRMSTADRLLELAVRNGLELNLAAFKEAAAAIANELIAEPSGEASPDDLLFADTDNLAKAHDIESDDDDTHSVDDEGEEQLKDKFLPLYAQIAMMTASQKIRRAQVGTAAERLLLVRDTNRLVSVAAVKSPAMRESEAVLISASRNVGEEVLREIAKNREFTRNYQVKLNLTRNPRCPFSFSARIIPLLRDNDLRDLAKSKNIPGAVQQAARQQIERKKGGK
ncbi:MAG: hypothetical protein IPI67_16635 [Myxococcales bacterium]|nr:hypothetical protein [Myxococcales bacterium]